jgi:coproporphyrinogen III oxidase-like Fe-S oxidoreductase
MENLPIELRDQLVEEWVLQALICDAVLPYAELKTRAATRTDDATFQRILNELIARGLVQRKAARRSLWYIGYTQARPANPEAWLDDIPAPFRAFLRELAW